MSAVKSLLDRVPTRVRHRPNLPKPEDLIKKWNIIRGDEVMIISGKEKGMTGRVTKVFRDTNKLIVSEKNLVWKHIPKQEDGKGGKVQKEMPIHYSNVMLVDPNTRRPCKIELRKVPMPEDSIKAGKLKNQRFVKGTNTLIPRPKFTEYIEARLDGPYDTQPEDVTAVTYIPTLNKYPLPYNVIDELRNPKQKAYEYAREIKSLLKKKLELQTLVDRMERKEKLKQYIK